MMGIIDSSQQEPTMTGSTFYPLGQQIADTAQAHGIFWAAQHYAKRGVPLAEFLVLARGARAV
jgi:hypothetical protein